ncbi:hypothetical protein L8S62_00565 [Enterobacter cloacae]|uniref:hypothetical protein n=1 Tax=Enterobacter cloacae TaxID=550 RepID=UPI002004978C|nr:hypothetical protein [Enterobacter cloacae]MCK6740938.1 hypothetical protein [Enterobacter cloacae]MCK6780943.1 hypothetical protein [Enterobacter cloacae]
MKTLTIGWLNKCRCGNKSHTVKTVRGNDAGLWDDDAVKCNSCGRGGIIQVCEGQARVLWETDEEMAENKPMSTITRERLEQLANFRGAPVTRQEEQELAHIALESQGAKKIILYRERNPYNGLTTGWQELTDDEYEFIKDNAGENAEFRTVFTAPPVPASVPTFEEWCERTEQKPVGWVRDVMKEAYDGCRNAMLQGAEPVTTAYKLPEGWVAVPVEPTEDMIVNGFESEPDESFSDEKEWEAYDAMSGCQQAAHRAKLCWAAMIAVAPK